MRVRLPSGEVINLNLDELEEPADLNIPSRRHNRNASGRRGRRVYNGRQKVGGLSDLIGAMLAPADRLMCVIAPTETTGWKSNGEPNRL